jgi:hypothetical protein
MGKSPDGTRRVIARLALVAMLALIVIGISQGQTWLALAGAVGAIPAVAVQLGRSRGEPVPYPNSLTRPYFAAKLNHQHARQRTRGV